MLKLLELYYQSNLITLYYLISWQLKYEKESKEQAIENCATEKQFYCIKLKIYKIIKEISILWILWWWIKLKGFDKKKDVSIFQYCNNIRYIGSSLFYYQRILGMAIKIKITRPSKGLSISNCSWKNSASDYLISIWTKKWSH